MVSHTLERAESYSKHRDRRRLIGNVEQKKVSLILYLGFQKGFGENKVEKHLNILV